MMPRYNLHFTLDYEIHGNGDGNPMDLMVKPTYRLMDLLERYGQRVTIMADVAEILAFERYCNEHGRDDYHVKEIREQLCEAIRRGHDVQLHVHSSYFHAKWHDGAFDQCIEDYNMAALPIERIDEIVCTCVRYLEDLLRPIKPDYKVWLFRAANWSMMPTENLYKVLVKYGITADTSVYKGGVQGGNVCYDYRYAFDNLLSYPADPKDINKICLKGLTDSADVRRSKAHEWRELKELNIDHEAHELDENHSTCVASSIPSQASLDGLNEQHNNVTNISFHSNKLENDYTNIGSAFLTEFPIYCEMRPFWHFISVLRVFRMIRAKFHKHKQHSSEADVAADEGQRTEDKGRNINKADNRKLTLKSFFRLSPWKMDFNQGTSRQLIAAMKRIMRRKVTDREVVDVILIGHSKTFVPYNEKTIEPFLRWVQKQDCIIKKI